MLIKLSKVINSLYKLLNDATFRFNIMSNIGIYNFMSDEKYLKKKFKIFMGKKLDLEKVNTFNEKIQWLKINDRNDLYTIMADKYLSKEYIASIIGKEYVVPLLGVWDKAEEIEFDKLPKQFVLKTNHDCGGLVICKNKDDFNKKKAIKELNNHLSKNYYLSGREWPYKNIKRKIFAEKYLEDNLTKELRDYKFFCFNGKVKCFKIDFDRFIKHRANYYNSIGEIIPCGEVICPPDFKRNIKMPVNLELMIKLAEKLSKNISFLRVDFYEVDEKVYFGELTFFPASGFGKFIDEKWDYVFGEWLKLKE